MTPSQQSERQGIGESLSGPLMINVYFLIKSGISNQILLATLRMHGTTRSCFYITGLPEVSYDVKPSQCSCYFLIGQKKIGKYSSTSTTGSRLSVSPYHL